MKTLRERLIEQLKRTEIFITNDNTLLKLLQEVEASEMTRQEVIGFLENELSGLGINIEETFEVSDIFAGVEADERLGKDEVLKSIQDRKLELEVSHDSLRASLDTLLLSSMTKAWAEKHPSLDAAQLATSVTQSHKEIDKPRLKTYSSKSVDKYRKELRRRIKRHLHRKGVVMFYQKSGEPLPKQAVCFDKKESMKKETLDFVEVIRSRAPVSKKHAGSGEVKNDTAKTSGSAYSFLSKSIRVIKKLGRRKKY